MFELEQQLLDMYLSKQDKNKQQSFLSSYKQLPEDEKEAILMELNSLYGLQSNQQQQGLNFAPQAPQPQMKYGGKSKYQSGGRKQSIAALQKELANRGFKMSKSKKKSGAYDGVVGIETTRALQALAKAQGKDKEDVILDLMGDNKNAYFVDDATQWFIQNPRARTTSKKTQKALASLPVQQAPTYNPTEVALRETSREYNRATLPTATVTGQRIDNEVIGNEYRRDALAMGNATGISPEYFNARHNNYVPQRTQPQSNYMNPYAVMQQAPVDPQQYAQYIDGLKNYVMPAVSMAIPFEGAMAYGAGRIGSSVAKALPRVNYPKATRDLFNQAKQVGYQGNLDDFVKRTNTQGDFLGLNNPIYDGFRMGGRYNPYKR